MSQFTSTPSKRTSGLMQNTRQLTDEMPDPDNLRIDRTALVTLPIQLPPAPTIGERLAPARHRAEYTRSA